jgi:hypothetical protein
MSTFINEKKDTGTFLKALLMFQPVMEKRNQRH